MTTITTDMLRYIADTLGQRPEYALQVFISNFDMSIDDTPADTDETEAQEAAMQDDVTKVARAIFERDGKSWSDVEAAWPYSELAVVFPWYLDAARAAMAATLELTAEAARECAAESAGSGYAHHMDSAADWLQQRANDVKEARNG